MATAMMRAAPVGLFLLGVFIAALLVSLLGALLIVLSCPGFLFVPKDDPHPICAKWRQGSQAAFRLRGRPPASLRRRKRRPTLPLTPQLLLTVTEDRTTTLIYPTSRDSP
jgi:hypothetical protein